jgi:hypothetical protein
VRVSVTSKSCFSPAPPSKCLSRCPIDTKSLANPHGCLFSHGTDPLSRLGVWAVPWDRRGVRMESRSSIRIALLVIHHLEKFRDRLVAPTPPKAW